MHLIETTMHQFLKKMEQESKKVILFGTGYTARQAIDKMELHEKILFVCDNDKSKQGKCMDIDGYSYPIKNPEMLAEVKEDAVILIVSALHYQEIIEQLQGMPTFDDTECYVYSRFAHATQKNTVDFYYERVVSPYLFVRKEILQQQKISKAEQNKILAKEKRYLFEKNAKGELPLAVPRIAYKVTTACTLKCKECCAMIPYLDKCGSVPVDTVLRDLQRFLNAIDVCGCVDITGGEPLLYKDLALVLNTLADSKKVMGISFATNGTVVPSEDVIRACQNEKVSVRISDYGMLDTMGQVISAFEKAQVNFQILTDAEWFDFGYREFHSRKNTPEQMRKKFLTCHWSATIKPMKEGKIFSCGRAALFYDLGWKQSESDYMELSENTEINKERIRQLYCNTDTASACDYCDAGDTELKKIPVGEQMEDGKEQSNYTVISRKKYEQLMKLEEKMMFH